MDHATRMFKTLGSLAAAMVSATALLGWIDPFARIPPAPLTLDELLPVARSLVADGIEIRADRWREIEVVAGSTRTATSRFLTASADREPPHFLIDEDGRPRRAARWLRQRPLVDRPSVIRIQVARISPGLAMSAIQSISLRAIAVALGEVIAPEGTRPLPVRLPDD